MKHAALEAGDKITCDLPFTPIQLDSTPGIPEGYIAGIASTPTTDRHGHKVLAKAFDESIKEKGFAGPSGIQLLVGHDWNKVGGKIKRLFGFGSRVREEIPSRERRIRFVYGLIASVSSFVLLAYILSTAGSSLIEGRQPTAVVLSLFLILMKFRRRFRRLFGKSPETLEEELS